MDISDAEDAFSKGTVNWRKFTEEFNLRWFKPQAETMLAMLLAGITPEERAQLGDQLPLVESAFAQAFGRNGGSDAASETY